LRNESDSTSDLDSANITILDVVRERASILILDLFSGFRIPDTVRLVILRRPASKSTKQKISLISGIATMLIDSFSLSKSGDHLLVACACGDYRFTSNTDLRCPQPTSLTSFTSACSLLTRIRGASILTIPTRKLEILLKTSDFPTDPHSNSHRIDGKSA
jgi:hypothetical protein